MCRHTTPLAMTCLLLAILLSGCASPSTPAPTPVASPPAPTATASPTQPPAGTPDPAACDLTASLGVRTWVGVHKINDVGTKECDYSLYLHNAHRTETVIPLVFQRRMLALDGTDQTTWQALPPIAPGQSLEWIGYVYLWNDARARLPEAQIPQSIVALRSDAACAAFQSDAAYLHAHAVPVEEPCSSDVLLWPDFLPATVPGPDG